MPLSTKTTADSLLLQTAELEKLLNPKNESGAKIYDFSGKQGTRARQKLAEKIQKIETALNNIQETDPSKLLKLKDSLVHINLELSNIQDSIDKKNQQIQSNQKLSLYQKIRQCIRERNLSVFSKKQETDLPRFKHETALKKLYDSTVALRFESRDLQDFLVEEKDDTEATAGIKNHIGKWFAEKSGEPHVLLIKISRSYQDKPDTVKVEVVDEGFFCNGKIYESMDNLLTALQAKTHISKENLEEIQNLAIDPTTASTLFSDKEVPKNQFLIVKDPQLNVFTLWTQGDKFIKKKSITIDALGKIAIDNKTYKNLAEAKEALGLSDTVTHAKESLEKRQRMLNPGKSQFDPFQVAALQTRIEAAKSSMIVNQEYYLISGNGSPIENSTTITVHTLKKAPGTLTSFLVENLTTSKKEFSVTENGIGDYKTWQEFATAHIANKEPFSTLETSYAKFQKDSAPYLKKSKDEAIEYLDQAKHVTPAGQNTVAVYEEDGKLYLAYCSSRRSPSTEPVSIEKFADRLNELNPASPNSINESITNRKKILTNIRQLSCFSHDTKDIILNNFSNYKKLLPTESSNKFALFMDENDVYICYSDNNRIHVQTIDISKLKPDVTGNNLLTQLVDLKGFTIYNDVHEKYSKIVDMESKLQNTIFAITSDHPGKIYPASAEKQARTDFTNAVTLKKPVAYVLWETGQGGKYNALLLKDGKEHTCTIDLVKNPGKLSVTIDGTENTYDDPEVLKTLGFSRAAHTYNKDVVAYNQNNKALMSQIKIASTLNQTATAQNAQEFARQAAAYHEPSDIVHYVRMENPEPTGILAKSWQYATSFIYSKPVSFTPTVYVLSLLVKQKDNSYTIQEHTFSLNPASNKILLNEKEYDTFNDALSTLTKGKSTISLEGLNANITKIRNIEHLLEHQGLTSSKEEIETALRDPGFVAVYASSRQESTVSVNSQNLPIEKTEYSLAYYDTTKKTIVQKKIDLYTEPGKVGVDGKFFDSLARAAIASCGNRRFLTDDDIRLQKPVPQQSVTASVDVTKPEPRNVTIQTVQPASQQVSSTTATLKAQYAKLTKKEDRLTFAGNITGSDTDRAAIYKAILPLSIFVPAITYNLDGTTPQARWNEIKGKVAEFDVANLTQKDARDLLLGILGSTEKWSDAKGKVSEVKASCDAVGITDPAFKTLRNRAGV